MVLMGEKITIFHIGFRALHKESVNITRHSFLASNSFLKDILIRAMTIQQFWITGKLDFLS